MRSANIRKAKGFSLIELVIVVVIIGIIAAIAIPRISRGSEGAADSALMGNLSVLRNAVDLFATEHAGTFPTAAKFSDELVMFTDNSGGTSTTKTATHIYGPYLRKIMPLSVGSNKGNDTIADEVGGDTIGVAGKGWFYNENTGVIKANLPDAEVDASGTPYNQF